jgi:hypothetical protein
MSETLTTYRKIVKLPAEDVQQSWPMRVALDDQVHGAVTSLTTHAPNLQIKRSSDDYGICNIHASANGYDIVITTRSGQDSALLGRERRVFVSYTLSATSSLRSLDRAATFSREVSLILRGVGGVLFACLFFWGIDLMFSGSGMVFIHLPLALVIAVVLAGAWLGERVGYLLGNQLESRACAMAEKTGALPQLDLLWADLEEKFTALLQSYEQV